MGRFQLELVYLFLDGTTVENKAKLILTKILGQINGQINSFSLIYSITDPNEVVNCPTEFLNSLDLPGASPHIIQLKVGSVIIMLRNLNQPKLCNGTT